ncbi:unnamed protein product [Microthlaspi erraticum]|uniref:Uncharacterized protein n=1 Tax=Microthlaspi erraticum TaxID=1685480 RepID=A0A6D2IWQ7_9BRAS|nr:unnamed protein product [Microthlaspi erraticum]
MKATTIVIRKGQREKGISRSDFAHFTISGETTAKMDEQNDAGAGGDSSLFDGSAHWWWAMGSGAQIMWGVRCIRRGYAGDMRLMPLKAFGVASLFVGAIATTSVAFLSASGIHTVQDAIDLGECIRTNMGIHPQIPKKQITETDDLS